MKKLPLQTQPRRRWRLGLVGALLATPLLACGAAQVTEELGHARAAYQRASTGPAAKLQPAQVHEARVALHKAEIAFADDPESDVARDLAYIALRKAEVAQALAAITAAEQRKVHAQRELQQTKEQIAARTRGELMQTREQLAAEKARLELEQQQLRSVQDKLQSEQAARLQAEREAQEALDKLEAIAAVKQDVRGTVITLSGSVVFETGKSTLLPSAQQRLDQVAEALESQPEGQRIVIEGHTDAVGSDQMNQQLSLARAQAVRSYLISQGVAPEQLVAVGLGESQPVANNASAEGRANNRRVEIVLQPASAPAGPAAPRVPDEPQGKEPKVKSKRLESAPE